MATKSKAKNEGGKKPAGGLLGGAGNGTKEAGFDWGSVEATRIAGIIELVTGRGGAIRFGYSRDGGAGSIGVYLGDQRDTVYIRGSQDPEEVLGLIERTFEAFPFTGGESPSN